MMRPCPFPDGGSNVRVMARLIVCLTAILANGSAQADDAPDGDTSGEVETGRFYDCGTLALYNLLRLEGVPAELPEIEGRLPESTPRGRSLYDLLRTAEHFGVHLEGVRSSRRPGRPALAHLQLKEHGHYVVLRPVGHTGRLLQVLDGLSPPAVVDAAEYSRSDSWTGYVLVRKRGRLANLAKTLGIASLLVLPLSYLAILALRARASKRQPAG